MATISSTIKIFDGFSAPLEKLSAGLNKGQSGFERFKSVMSGGGNLLGGLNKSVGQTGGLFKSVLGGTVIGSGITKGIGLATSGIQSMIGELNEASTSWQTFDGNMNMLGKSPAEIASAKKDMQKFAQQTIYSASDMSQTYAQLAAVGTKDTGKLVKGFGGLASASENPAQAMKTLSQQATQAAAKPYIQWQDFKLMLEQTPAGMAAVAKTMGMSTKDLVTKVQDGTVATQDFFNAIAKTGTNADFTKMATQYKTVGQAMDGLKETLANKMQNAFDRVGKVGIKWVSKLTDTIGDVNFDSLADNAMSAINKVIGIFQNTLMPIFTDMFNGFKSTGAVKAIQDMFGDVKGAVSKIFDSAFAGGDNPFENLSKFAGGAVKGIAKAIGAISRVIGDMDPNVLKAIGVGFLAIKSGTTGLVVTGVVALFNAIGRMDPKHVKDLAGALKWLVAGFAALKLVNSIAKGFDSLNSVFGGLGKGMGNKKLPIPDPAKTAQSASSLMKMGAALMMVGAGVALAGGGMLLMAMATQKIASAGGSAIAVFFGMFAAIALLAGVVKLLGPTFIASAAGFLIFAAALLVIGISIVIAAAGISMLATQLPLISIYGTSAAVGLLALAGAMAVFGLAAIVGAIGVIALGVALAVLGVGFLIGAVGAVLFGASLLIVGVGALIAVVGVMMLGIALVLVSTFAIVGAVGLMLMAVALVMIAAVALIAGVGMMVFAVALMLAAPLMMIAAVGALLLGVATIVLGAGLLIVGAALMVVASGLTMVASAVISLATAFIMAGTMMVSAIVSAMSGVVNAVSSGIQSAVSAAKAFGSALVSVGRDLIQGLVNGIKSMIGSAISAVSSVASKVVSTAKSILHIGSPSKLFNQYGRWVDQGLINGLNRDSGSAADASANMAQGVVDAASNMNPQIGPMTMGGFNGSNPGDMLANGFQRALDLLTALMSTFQGFNGTNLGVNSTVHRDDDTGDDNFGFVGGSGFGGTGMTDSGSSSGSQVTVNFGAGAIQIQSTGNVDYDAERLVTKIEEYLMNRNNASLS